MSEVLQCAHRSALFATYAGFSSSSVATPVQSRCHSSARRALDGFVGGQRRRDGGRAQDGVAAQVVVATFAKNAESAPPLKATTTSPALRGGAQALELSLRSLPGHLASTSSRSPTMPVKKGPNSA